MIGNTLLIILLALSTITPNDVTETTKFDEENFLDENQIETFGAVHEGPVTNPGASNNTSIYGYVNLFPHTEDIDIPLCSIKVELLVDGSSTIDSKSLETYTDENGYYCFKLNEDDYPSLYNSTYHTYQIKCYAEGKTFSIGKDYVINQLSDFCSYSVESDKKESEKIGSTTQINLYINETSYSDDNNTYKAFSVAGAMGYAENFMFNYDGFPESPDMVYYVYPFPDGMSFTFKQHGGIAGNRWDNWKTAIHEYGHYVEWVMGTYKRRIWGFITNSVSHYTYEDLIYKANNKQYGLYEVYDESWASILSMLVYNHYDTFDENPYVGEISDLIDDADSYAVTDEEYQDICGEGQEESLITYLWNVIDDKDEKNIGDVVSLSEEEFLNLTIGKGTTTLPDFVNNFESTYPSLIFENSVLLEECKIAPTIVSYNEDVSASVPLTLNFIANGSCYNPNDKFTINFYNSAKTRIVCQSNINVEINGNRGITTYTMSNDDWKTLYRELRSLTRVYVSIEGYLSSDPESGPYRSALVQLPISRYPNGGIIKDPAELYNAGGGD